MSPTATPPAYSSRGSPGQRLISAALALAVAALIVLLLILSGFLPQVFVPVGAPALSTFNVAAGGETPTPRPKPRAKPAAKRAAAPPSRTTLKPIVPMPVSPPTGMIVLSKDEFAATDIGKIKGAADTGDSDKGAQTADSGSAYGPGAGPGGKRLYAAEWYREPTRQEMAFYMPHGMVEGWGLIACQTIERYHVDNCRVLGESPGSGISRGMRQAAWQFLVRPPRVDGKPMVGAWVSIRYDIVRGVAR